MLRVLPSADERQLQPEQAIDQPMLGRLKPLPALALFGNAKVGNGSVQPAGGTQRTRAGRRQQPVAGAMRGIATEPAQPFRVGERLPVAIACGCERAQDGQLG